MLSVRIATSWEENAACLIYMVFKAEMASSVVFWLLKKVSLSYKSFKMQMFYNNIKNTLIRLGWKSFFAYAFRTEYEDAGEIMCAVLRSVSLICRLTGFAIPAPVTSSGSIFSLRLTSDFAVSAHGFKVAYEGKNAGILFCSSSYKKQHFIKQQAPHEWNFI